MQTCKIILARAILNIIANRRGVPLPPGDNVGQPQPEDQVAISLNNGGAAQAA